MHMGIHFFSIVNTQCGMKKPARMYETILFFIYLPICNPTFAKECNALHIQCKGKDEDGKGEDVFLHHCIVFFFFTQTVCFQHK